jgi:hypothetical protein
MTRIIFKTLIIIILTIGCNSKSLVNEETCCAESSKSSTQFMQVVDYEYGENEPIPNLNGQVFEKGVSIVVDTQLKVKNFIAFREMDLRRHIQESQIKLDLGNDEDLQYYDGTKQQRIKQFKNRLKKLQKMNDSFHLTNNRWQQQVWLINNSEDTIHFPLNLHKSFRCRLEGIAKDGVWKPIQCSKSLSCLMNDLELVTLLPKMANRFVTPLPNKGSFKTKFRYRILTTRRYYYSNEFDGAIDCCAFVIDSIGRDYPDLSEYKWDKNGHFIRPIIENESSLNVRFTQLIESIERFLED